MRNGLIFVCMLLSSTVFSWNALGHRIIAQIAYDKIAPYTKKVLNKYNHALDKIYKPQTLVESAVWLDMLRYQRISWYAAMHYIDIPFSNDKSLLPAPQDINAVWAIESATHVLLNKYATDFDKGIALRILLHVVGDLHQPLHATTRVSAAFPKGDKGGNLVRLEHNSVAKNLHAYWDRGAGLLVVKKRYDAIQVKKMARMIVQHWPCDDETNKTPAPIWAEESHALALSNAYKLPMNGEYQQRAQSITEHRLALAGCRLGWLLTTMTIRGSGPELVKFPYNH